MTLLEVKDLSVFFSTQKKKLHAVRNISFSLKEGEALGIVGESGCGKSATAKAIAQLLPRFSSHLSGEVLYQGTNLLSFSEKQMQRVRGKELAMIFQDPMSSLNPTIKIGPQIVEGFLRHNPGISREKAEAYAIELLTKVGIPQPELRIKEYPHTLSGGMRQRAMIALALSSNPKILIADEPTTALDVTIQAQILALLNDLRKKMSIILITHDLSVVANFCDRVLVMYGGKIVESATVDELFSHPKHPYTVRLLQSIPRLDMRKEHSLFPIEGTPPDLLQPQKGCSFCRRCSSSMNICSLQEPPLFAHSDSHYSACFLHDPRISP